MRKITIFFIIVLNLSILAQESKVFDNLRIKSQILNEEMNFSIYLPAGYSSSERSYPVVYLLHGYSDDHTAWIQFGEVQRIADKGIQDGTIAPMIIVMPDAGVTFYMNTSDGKYQYEDYFIKELIPFIEKNYRCRTQKEFRGIAGLSMGGFGSLLYSLHHPDMFAACSALSAGIRTDEEINQMSYDSYSSRYRKILGNIKEGENRITDFWNKNSIFYLLKNIPEEQKKAVHFYIDCGDDDFLYKGNSTLHILMRDLNIPHEYRVRDGAHTWEYWRTGLQDALAFISQSFHR